MTKEVKNDKRVDGIFTDREQTPKFLSLVLQQAGAIIFKYSFDNKKTVYTFFVAGNFMKVGDIEGFEKGRVFIGNYNTKKFYHFDLKQKIAPNVIGHELGINFNPAKEIAHLFNELGREMFKHEDKKQDENTIEVKAS